MNYVLCTSLNRYFTLSALCALCEILADSAVQKNPYKSAFLDLRHRCAITAINIVITNYELVNYELVNYELYALYFPK